MKTISEHQFKNNISAILDEIDKLAAIIISKKDKPSAVIMSLKSYEAIEIIFELMNFDPQQLYKLYLESKQPKLK